MADSNLKEVIQLPLDTETATLVAWAVAMAVGIYNGDIMSQMRASGTIASLIDAMDKEKFDAFMDQMKNLSDVLRERIPQPDESTCKHCPCPDPICCWCGGLKT